MNIRTCISTGSKNFKNWISQQQQPFNLISFHPFTGANQVETFLEEHNGPGIQHIGLYAPDIINTVQHLRNRGLQFIQPPAAYYTEVKFGTLLVYYSLLWCTLVTIGYWFKPWSMPCSEFRFLVAIVLISGSWQW